MSLGGAAMFVRNLCRVSRHDHHILGIQPKWEIMDVSGLPYFECLSVGSVRRLIHRERYDLLHWHWWQPLDLMTHLADWNTGIPQMVTVHVYGYEPPYVLGQFEIELADKIVFVTPSALGLPENRDIPEHKVCVINAGADLAPFLKIERTDRPGFVIGRAGVLNRSKCPGDIVDVLKRIQIPEAEFLVAGDGELRKGFEKQLGNDSHRFVFLGFVRDMVGFYASLDLYCYQLPAKSYAAAELNIQEAMAAALPIVMFPSPGARHLIEHGVTGLIAHSADELVTHCETLYQDRDARAVLSRNARKTVVAQYGIENSARAFDQVFASLAG